MFDKHYLRPEPSAAFIPPSVIHYPRAEAGAYRAGAHIPRAQKATFQERLMAREGARPLSTLAMLSQLDERREVLEARRRRGRTRPPVGELPDLPRHATNGGGGGGGRFNRASAPGSGKWTDMGQVALAGLAALGLAGLSVVAAESALNGGEKDTQADASADTEARLVTQVTMPQGATSTQALQQAATEAVRTPWFDYEDFAARVSAAQADYAAAQQAAAEAERLRIVAENEAAQTAAAEAEALRLAQLEAEAKAAAEAEAKRLAQAEADRIAAQEAEQARLAELAAERDAQARADAEAERLRLAEAEAQAKADAAANKRAEQEAAAAREAQRQADAAAAREEATQEKLAAARAAKAKRLAAAEAAQQAAADVAATTPAPTPDVQNQPVAQAYTGLIPTPASFKPVRGPGDRLSATPDASRTAPHPVTAEPPPQRIDLFMAERVRRTAERPIPDTEMAQFRQTFIDLVRTTPDGQTVDAHTPDGRIVQVTIEQTRPIEVSRAIVRPINYTMATRTESLRFIADVRPGKETIMCRDVNYSFPRAERGRFAACPEDNGDWVIRRAADRSTLDDA